MEEHLLKHEGSHEKGVVILQRVRTSLIVQWFRLHLPMGVGADSIPAWGTGIPDALQ